MQWFFDTANNKDKQMYVERKDYDGEKLIHTEVIEQGDNNESDLHAIVREINRDILEMPAIIEADQQRLDNDDDDDDFDDEEVDLSDISNSEYWLYAVEGDKTALEVHTVWWDDPQQMDDEIEVESVTIHVYPEEDEQFYDCHDYAKEWLEERGVKLMEKQFSKFSDILQRKVEIEEERITEQKMKAYFGDYRNGCRLEFEAIVVSPAQLNDFVGGRSMWQIKSQDEIESWGPGLIFEGYDDEAKREIRINDVLDIDPFLPLALERFQEKVAAKV